MKVILLTSSWCKPCKEFNPVFNKVMNEYPDIEFETVDIQQDEDKVPNIPLRSVPTVVITDDTGEFVDIITGIVNREVVVDKINSILGR